MLAVIYAALLLAHSWYPASCCGGGDCQPIDSKYVKQIPGGYEIDYYEGNQHWSFTIQEVLVQRSKDDQYHICVNLRGGLRCFFRPEAVT
jgi:hypothetical protein